MPKRATSTSFVKGDPRINRDGRPKDSQSLSALIRRIGHEVATTKDGAPLLGPDGRPMTVVEAVIRQRFQDKRYQEDMLNRGWGKAPDTISVEHSGQVQVVHDLSALTDEELDILDQITAKLAGQSRKSAAASD